MVEIHYNLWSKLTPEQIASNHKEFELSELVIEEENVKRDDEASLSGVNPVCHDCDKAKTDVTLRTDPYRKEVHGGTESMLSVMTALLPASVIFKLSGIAPAS